MSPPSLIKIIRLIMSTYFLLDSLEFDLLLPLSLYLKHSSLRAKLERFTLVYQIIFRHVRELLNWFYCGFDVREKSFIAVVILSRDLIPSSKAFDLFSKRRLLSKTDF